MQDLITLYINSFHFKFPLSQLFKILNCKFLWFNFQYNLSNFVYCWVDFIFFKIWLVLNCKLSLPYNEIVFILNCWIDIFNMFIFLNLFKLFIFKWFFSICNINCKMNCYVTLIISSIYILSGFFYRFIMFTFHFFHYFPPL